MSRPQLWHLPVSHYSEKVRWALAYKDVEHGRHAPPPGSHIPIALVLTRGRTATLPVLGLDGRHVGDSTAIIAALEERYPDPPLYPVDPHERRRALELEDWFDEQVGPAMRQFAFHTFRSDPERFRAVAVKSSPPPLRRFSGALGAYGRAFTNLRFKAGDAAAAARSREQIVAGLDRIETELGGADYLVGDRFSVADLTAAALLYPLVLPPGSPLPRATMPAELTRFVAGLGDRRALEWIEQTYARHRAHRSRRAKPASAH